jgi:EAL domain-containing protein (putative c-di-GMP-specific phosphodiesterase class I)
MCGLLIEELGVSTCGLLMSGGSLYVALCRWRSSALGQGLLTPQVFFHLFEVSSVELLEWRLCGVAPKFFLSKTAPSCLFVSE